MDIKVNKDTVILLISTLIIALCGLLYELLIGSTSSYLLGSSVKQFSFTIGAFMTAFGIGSFFSKYFMKNIVRTFFIVEVIIGFLGSISIVSLFYFYSISDLYLFVMYFFIVSIGALVGLEIPLIGRIIDEIKKDIRITLANLLSFDYIGAMIGSVLLPLVLLPKLGLIKSSILIGIGNLIVSLLVGFRFRKKLSKTLVALPIVLIGLNVFFFINASSVQTYIEQKFYNDKIIYQKHSKYQKIVLTKEGNDLRLYLDGNIQFSSSDEYRYHESLVHVPFSSLKKKDDVRVLILGGGDGLAIREVLKYNYVKDITVCDLDPDIVTLSKTHPLILKINQNALANKKVKIVNKDAFIYLQEELNKHSKKWDIILIDLPDPNNESLAKLYSVKFYKLVKASLTEGGIGVTQSASPFHARRVFWCINATVKHSGFKSVLPYKTEVPSFGLWGFIMFSDSDMPPPENLKIDEAKLKYLTTSLLRSLFIFPKDIANLKTEINKIFRPSILMYYEKSWKRY